MDACGSETDELILRFLMRVAVRFRIMAGVVMIVRPMITLVFMMMIPGSSAAMRMLVIVLMDMIVTMPMDVFVAVFHIPVSMFMGVLMRVIVVM